MAALRDGRSFKSQDQEGCREREEEEEGKKAEEKKHNRPGRREDILKRLLYLAV